MKVIIMGCGRVGAQMAALLDQEGHSVTTLDTDAYSFRRLPPDFKGEALLGDGLDEDVLRRVGIEEADAFVAVTQEDNRNVMAAQIAQKIFNVKKVVCRIYDPMRRDLYSVLGLEAISPTTVLAEMLKEKLES
ncbi:potassium channel family protein [Dehalogenimonas etheniformans]|uniref:TrkA family potassium uptake protein n=1 Tax=Dehalogenimonas etheniformans TaxID=1536648 RepID=A0A2P5P781_9CHLR|nr:TrkA family potassium uptake protein [Dehalogenimonas etheniformans]PPD58140.1 TrkA family potassium uptake protein [Dehalogenimonas etheniformans]QNT75547.1 TrkA family potassium uptake protein [Dehalogenimonas etheniformans]